jgi:membrane protease YdiL (CAAX protease family)
VVLLVAVLPEIWLMSTVLIWPSMVDPGLPASYSFFYQFTRHIQVIALTLYIIWRSTEPLSYFGLARLRERDAREGLGLFFLAFLAYAIYSIFVWIAVPADTLERYSRAAVELYPPPAAPGDYILAFAALPVSAFAEELVLRGYLLPRLEHLLRSTCLSVLATSALFAVYHLYQGPLGAGIALVVGLVFGAAFARTRRLWPLVFANLFVDAATMLWYASRSV